MSAAQAREGLLKPFIIALLSAGLTLAGAMVTDRVSRASFEGVMTTKIEGLAKRVDEQQNRLTWMSENLATRGELREDLQTIEQRLNDLRVLATNGRNRE